MHAVFTIINTCALAALAAVSAASAQSTVTISGNMSAGMSSLAGVKSIAGLDSTNSNLLNFKAVEDLGGGLTATANIGIRFDVNQNAASTSFGNSKGDTYVELASKTLGAIRAGTFTSYSASPYSAFATWNTTNTSGSTSTQSVNQVRYASPRISGFAVNLSSFTPFTAASVSAVGAIGNATQKHGTQVLATYVNGPLTVSYGNTSFTATQDTTEVKQTTLDGSYDFKIAKLYVQSWDQKEAVTGVTNLKGYGISADIPYQAFTFKVGMRKYNSATTAAAATLDRTSLGVTYSLSKRTTVLALLAKDKTIDAAATKTTNTYLGVAHAF
jgi:predicted porin